MANTSVDGLISGLDTTTIITQLMALEKQPQDRLKTQKTDVGNEIAVYQVLNSKFSTLASAAQDLARPAGWRAMKATSSSAGVTATAGAGASSGSSASRFRRCPGPGPSPPPAPSLHRRRGRHRSGRGGLGADLLGFARLGGGGRAHRRAHTIEVTQATPAPGRPAPPRSAGTTTLCPTPRLRHRRRRGQDLHHRRRELLRRPSWPPAVTPASGGDLTAAVDGSGKLTLTTTHEGSAAGLAVTGGSAAASLSLAVGGPAPPVWTAA